MNDSFNRKFNCKHEELPFVCAFTSDTLLRDLLYFNQFSSKYDEAYVTGYRTRIDAVAELVSPVEETKQIALLTEEIQAKLDEVADDLNRLQNYVEMAKKAIPLSASAFAIIPCRHAVNKHDNEGVVNQLKIVNNNIVRYHDALIAEGMSEAFAGRMAAIPAELTATIQKRYSIVSRRAELVQSNMEMLNALFDEMNMICKTGKTLFRKTNPAKTRDYTFRHLLQQLRRLKKGKDETDGADAAPENEPEA